MSVLSRTRKRLGYPHQAADAEEMVEDNAEDGKDHAQPQHCQQQRCPPLPHGLEDGIVHVEQAHADHTPGPPAHERTAHGDGLLMVDEEPHDGVRDQLHNGEEHDGEKKEDDEGETAHRMDPLVVLGAVAVPDQGHDALSDADADVQCDGIGVGYGHPQLFGHFVHTHKNLICHGKSLPFFVVGDCCPQVLCFINASLLMSATFSPFRNQKSGGSFDALYCLSLFA